MLLSYSQTGFTELLQILYVISAFQVMSGLGFIVMDAVLLFISVSSGDYTHLLGH